MVYDVGGSVDVPVRHYHCSTHFVKKKEGTPGREVRRSLLAPDIHAELADTLDVDIDNPIIAFQGGSAFTLACAIHIWHSFVDNGFNIRHVSRNMQAGYNAIAAVKRRAGRERPAKPTPGGRPEKPRPNPKAPKDNVLLTLCDFLQRWFETRKELRPSTRVDEDEVWRCDMTYGVAQTIGVTVSGRWVQYSYCLSSLLGATGQVLDQDFLPSEAHEHVEKQFKKRLRFLKAAGKPPPRFGCFDDVAKMRHAFLRWVKDVWEEDPEDIKDYRTPQVVLDIQHFKMLLLEGLEESHPDFKEITSEVGQALGRLLGYKNFYTTPEDVREDFQRIYNKYTSLVGGKVLPVGSRFVKTAEFGVACAMGKALKDGTPFEFTGLKAMQKGLSQGGILASGRAGRAWICQLDKDAEYWRSLWLNQAMVQARYVPGTSIVEAWHLYLKKYCHFTGRKNLALAQIEVAVCAAFYNHALANSLYTVKVGGNPLEPVVDDYGNERWLRVAKERIYRSDHRLDHLNMYTDQLSTLHGYFSFTRYVTTCGRRMPETVDDLQARGFKIRRATGQPMDDDEVRAVKQALQALFVDGPSIMGRYTKVCRWIARQYLHGSRTEIAVGRVVRDMMVAMLKSLKLRAVKANSAIVTTQDARLLQEKDIPALEEDCIKIMGWMVEGCGFSREYVTHHDADDMSCGESEGDDAEVAMYARIAEEDLQELEEELLARDVDDLNVNGCEDIYVNVEVFDQKAVGQVPLPHTCHN